MAEPHPGFCTLSNNKDPMDPSWHGPVTENSAPHCHDWFPEMMEMV